MSISALSARDRHLLLQLGDRLKRIRQEQGLSGVDLAARAGISRTTLRAVEAGDPSSSAGAYLRVISSLSLGGDLACLASGARRSKPAASSTRRSERVLPPRAPAAIAVQTSCHRVQDFQSLVLHEAAVAAIRREPQRLQQAKDTLQRWLNEKPGSRSVELWREWQDILAVRSWRRALGRTQRARQLRQASPLVTVLAREERLAVLAAVNELRRGVQEGGPAQAERDAGRRKCSSTK
ncbi:helix-turn-helix transcriptional regulator [Inhella sp.]|uniref:helix-turn-helix transcriptional regulator n=1 Tax=Inhella sp. TaxID=1921806 RepID=UPI0035AE5920